MYIRLVFVNQANRSLGDPLLILGEDMADQILPAEALHDHNDGAVELVAESGVGGAVEPLALRLASQKASSGSVGSKIRMLPPRSVSEPPIEVDSGCPKRSSQCPPPHFFRG